MVTCLRGPGWVCREARRAACVCGEQGACRGEGLRGHVGGDALAGELEVEPPVPQDRAPVRAPRAVHRCRRRKGGGGGAEAEAADGGARRVDERREVGAGPPCQKERAGRLELRGASLQLLRAHGRIVVEEVGMLVVEGAAVGEFDLAAGAVAVVEKGHDVAVGGEGGGQQAVLVAIAGEAMRPEDEGRTDAVRAARRQV